MSNAPDKIYLINGARLVDWIAPTWYKEPMEGCENHEYFRKQSLILWARDMQAERGETISFDELMEKLYSL